MQPDTSLTRSIRLELLDLHLVIYHLISIVTSISLIFPGKHELTVFHVGGIEICTNFLFTT